MSNNQKKDNSEEPKTNTNNIEQEIKKLEEGKIQAKERLELEYDSTVNELAEIAKDIELEQRRFDTAKKQISTAIEGFKTETSEFIGSSEKSIIGNFTEFATIVSKIVFWFRFSIVLFSAIFLGVYFGLYNQSFGKDAFFSINGLNFNGQSVITVGSLSLAVLVLFVIVHLGSRSIRKKIEKSRGIVDQNISDIQDKRPDVPQNYLDAGSFFDHIIKRVPIFDSRMKNIVKYSREFIPFLDKFYTMMERQNLQNQFHKSLKNALNAYGLFENPSSELTCTINTFSTPSNSELDWVNESVQKISFAFANSGIVIDEKIIKVIFYDYTNSDYLAGAWDDVLQEKGKLLNQFAYLLASRTLKIDVSGSYGALGELLEKINIFRLSEFQKDYYDFFVDFKRRKTHMKTAVTQMGFDAEVVELLIENFIPSTLNRDTWDGELSIEVCKKFDFDHRYLLLFYYDRIGFEDDGKRTWNEIKKSNDDALFPNFIKLLDSKDLLRIPELYRKNLDIPTFKKISNELPKFDFYKFSELVFSNFKIIDDAKNKIIHVLEDIKPTWTSSEFRNQLGSFVPASDDILIDIANKVEEITGMDHDLLLLFFGAKYDLDLAENHYNKIIKTKIQKLSEFLIDYELIKIEKSVDRIKDVNNVSSIITHVDKFDLVKLQSLYQQYSELLEVSTKLVQFLHQEKITTKETMDFIELINILPKPNNERLENILAVSAYLIKSYTEFSPNFDVVSKACSCLFLYIYDDLAAKKAGQQLTDQPSQILYHNMEVKGEDSFNKDEYPLKKIIVDVLDGSVMDYEYMADFKIGLSTGYLFRSKKEMMMFKLNAVQEQLQKISEIQEELDEMQDSVKTVLNQEFETSSGFLEYAIQSQIIQAYLITTRGPAPILGNILGDNEIMQRAVKEIQEDMDLSKFLITDPAIGSHTRMGVVPFNMNFDVFSEKFQDIYDRAVDIYITEKDRSRQKSEFQLNMFRFLISPATFKRVRLPKSTIKGNSESDDPIVIIRNLIKRNFSTDDNLRIFTTFNNKDSRLVIKDFIEKVCNENTSYLFIRKELPVLVSDHLSIEKIMNNPQFDRKLYDSFGVKDFSKLASIIYEARKSPTDDNNIIKTISDKITVIIKEQMIEVKQEDVKHLSDLLFNKLIKFGKIFSN